MRTRKVIYEFEEEPLNAPSDGSDLANQEFADLLLSGIVDKLSFSDTVIVKVFIIEDGKIIDSKCQTLERKSMP